jgi:single-stranded-DNA-specific exonuclease
LGCAEEALELLLTEDEERARRIAAKLDASNRQRRKIETGVTRAARRQLAAHFDPERHYGIVCAGEEWHVGVIGIVASRLVSDVRRPAIVVSLDGSGAGRGSGRGIEGLDLLECLNHCSDLLVEFGGHSMACGLSIEPGNVDAFRQRFQEVCAEELRGVDLRPVVDVDAWVGLGEIDEAFLAAQDRLRPFGEGNPTPAWGARGVEVVGRPRVVGDGHLKMMLGDQGASFDTIAFGMGNRDVPDGPIDVVFSAGRNVYMGRESIQLRVRDFRAAFSA